MIAAINRPEIGAACGQQSRCPTVGAPSMEVVLRPEAWDNAYVKVLELVGGKLGW